MTMTMLRRALIPMALSLLALSVAYTALTNNAKSSSSKGVLAKIQGDNCYKYPSTFSGSYRDHIAGANKSDWKSCTGWNSPDNYDYTEYVYCKIYSGGSCVSWHYKRSKNGYAAAANSGTTYNSPGCSQ